MKNIESIKQAADAAARATIAQVAGTDAPLDMLLAMLRSMFLQGWHAKMRYDERRKEAECDKRLR